MDVDRATYYFCDLKTNGIECQKMHECKRYEMVKDIPYNQYGVLGFAKLHNVCNAENNYQLFMKMDKNSEKKEV